MKPSHTLGMIAPKLGLLFALALFISPHWAAAQEAVIRKNISERMPEVPKIDEITKTPIAGIWEIRMGTDIAYTDDKGNYLIQGHLFDTRTKTDITEERIEKLTAIDFDTLPFKDAIVIKQGSGVRKLAIFTDPNCGYCKRLERDLSQLKDVTLYNFVMPILGPDSMEKARNIWCADDVPKAWRDWMINAKAAQKIMGTKCDTQALERNREFGRKYRVNGTPALVFESGLRKSGALPLTEVEKLLASQSNEKP